MTRFLSELKVATRSLLRAKGLTITVILTLALGIGANSAIFSLVDGVMLRPLVNRDEKNLIYIRQSTHNNRNATFSVPEIKDLQTSVKTLTSFGDFSVIGFTLNGLGDPRSVNSGVVGGSYFQTMGLRPVLGRLLDSRDDGPNAPGAVVLTYRFWSTALKSDTTVLGKTVRLGSFIDSHAAVVVGVLEPCVPFPQDTDIIANVVTSSHHMSATMVTNRLHRMTDLFARLAPGATLDQARAELNAVYGSMKKSHPEDYDAKADYQIHAVQLRDELTSGARTILLVLMAGSLLVFIIACSNVANLILARTVRRENELGIRAALGAGSAALRRILLSESLLLCTTGAVLGVVIANPLVSVLSRYIGRYSVRALDLSVDPAMLWVAAGLAVLASALLAFVPRLPSSGGAQGFSLASGSARVTGNANRKLKIFAVVQISACFVLVVASGATMKTLLSLQAAQPGFDTHNVLAINVPLMREGKTPQQVVDFHREAVRQIRALPGVQNVSLGSVVPWRDTSPFELEFGVDGHVPAPGEEHPRAIIRVTSPGFFATLGLPMLEGRDFTDADRQGTEGVAIISQSFANKMFVNRDPVGHHLQWTDKILKIAPGFVDEKPIRIVGVAQDVDDAHIVAVPTITVYRPFEQEQLMGTGRMFVHASSNPYALVMPVTHILRTMSADQPVEKATTLDDVRAEVLAPERLNVIISAIFAGVALLIAIVGVAGVLAFSVSGRTREFGIRLAIGSQPKNLLIRVITEGAVMATAGVVIGLGAGFWLAQLASSFIGRLQTPGALPITVSALLLLLAAVIASLVPAARAARVDVIQALRTE